MSISQAERFVRPEGARFLHKPDIRESESGLQIVQGYIHEVVDSTKTSFIHRETFGRSHCEAILLLTERPNGTVAFTITHFLPGYLESQILLVNAMTPKDIPASHNQTRHGEGKRRAIFLTTDPMSMNLAEREHDPRFGPIFRSLKAFNNGQDPDIIYTPAPSIREIAKKEFPSGQLELIYEMTTGINGQVKHAYGISGTSFQREGTMDEILTQGSINFAYIW